MTQEQFLLQVAETLEAVGIPFMVAGSHSSSFHGLPRMTNDVDFVIDPSRDPHGSGPYERDACLGLVLP